MDPLKKRLQEFVEQGIMEKVPDQEPITWCFPIVVQPKPKNPNDIHLSLDLRTLNKSMLRTRQVQAPITEDFITEIFNSQDLFDNEMAKILSGIPKTLNNRDDIMIGGVDLADHDKNVKTIF